jgi:hypothetical protein
MKSGKGDFRRENIPLKPIHHSARGRLLIGLASES